MTDYSEYLNLDFASTFNFSNFNYTSNSTLRTDVMDYVQKTIILSFIFAIVLIASLVSILFGLIFWILIPQWREFRHYALLSLLLSNGAIIFGQSAGKQPGVLIYFLYYNFLVFTHWLIVISGMIYFQIGRVFTTKIEDIDYIYLKTTVFSWLLPGIWVTIVYFSKCHVIIGYVFIVLVLINILTFSKGLFALYNPRSALPCLGIGKKIIFATFAFIFTGVLMSAPVLMMMYGFSQLSLHSTLAVGFTHLITTLIVNLFFLMQRVHREKWAEYQTREGLNNFL